MATKEYKYKSTFASVVKCIIDEDKNKFLSQASIEELRGIIPENALIKGKEDLLPIAANLAVINLMNLNGDSMDTPTALKIYSSLDQKYVNLEHDRDKIVGHVCSTSFSKFSSQYKTGVGSEKLALADIKETKGPFNLAYAAYVYKVVNEDLIAQILESSNPDSEKYLKIASSWEVSFSDYNIAIGSADLENATIITDEVEKQKYEPFLMSNGGKGKLDNGDYCYRVIIGEPVFMGVGLTLSPAASVAGITTPKQESTLAINTQIVESTKDLISHKPNLTVKENDTMKNVTSIDEIKSLKQEDLKDVSVASIPLVIFEKLKEVSETYDKQVKEKEGAVAKAEEKAVKAQEDADKANKRIEEITKELTDLKDKQTKVEAEQKFNTRMAHLDENYELDEDQRKVIVAEIPGLSDEDFTKWLSKFETLAKKMKKKPADKNKDKKNKDDDEDDNDDDQKDEKAKAKLVLEQALATAKKLNLEIPNTSTIEESVLDKYKAAFTMETVVKK